jgi:hypothetical protein
MSVLYKAGVCGDAHPMIQKAIGAVHRSLPDTYDLVVTSLRDGQHKAGSFHRIGRAVDLRPRCLSATRNATYILVGRSVKDVCATVSRYFQVIEEGDHIHIEYDPPEDK